MNSFVLKSFSILAGIYIHIPFCKKACYYCNFHFSTNLKPIDDLVAAIVLELRQRKSYLKEKRIETLYIGGGTPSLLSHHHIEAILKALKDLYNLEQLREFTVEVNPEDVNEDLLTSYKHFGVDRLSMGFQSLTDEVLISLNRSHSSKEALHAFTLARDFGFHKISIDLIYGIPGRSHDMWRRDLETIIGLGSVHISAYALTVEERTALYEMIKKGKREVADEEFVAQQFEIMLSVLRDAGYEQYEISNFCLKDHEAVHNSNYWRGSSYLGLGPGAHSYDGVSRQYNIEHNLKYISLINNDQVYFERESLSDADRFNEYLLTSIRTKWGTDMTQLSSYKNAVDRKKIEVFESKGLVSISNNHLCLTEKGKLLADEITAQLIIV